MSDQRYALPGHHAHVFISTLLTQHRYQNVNGGRALTEEEITGLLIAVLFAGQHTSSITTSWTGIFMAANKVGEERLYRRWL